MTSGLRILFVSAYPRNGVLIGGVESAVEALTEALCHRAEIEAIEILNFRNDLKEPERMQMNPKLGIHFLPAQRRWTLPTRWWRDYLSAKQIVAAFHPHIIHGQGLGAAGDIATRLPYPSVVTIHGMVNVEARMHHHPLDHLRVLLTDANVRRVLHHAGIVISISNYDQSLLHRYITHPVLRIPNAVRPQFLCPVEPVEDAKGILFAGVIDPRKNLEGIVQAFAKVRVRIPTATLALAGPVSDVGFYNRLADKIRDEGIGNVTYLGNLSREGLVVALGRSAVVVLNSSQENSPCIIAEAMAMGRPVVSSRVGGVPEMVKHGQTGYLVSEGDEEGLAACLVRLLDDFDLRRSMGRRAHELARVNWDPQKVAESTIEAYQLALNEARGWTGRYRR